MFLNFSLNFLNNKNSPFIHSFIVWVKILSMKKFYSRVSDPYALMLRVRRYWRFKNVLSTYQTQINHSIRTTRLCMSSFDSHQQQHALSLWMRLIVTRYSESSEPKHNQHFVFCTVEFIVVVRTLLILGAWLKIYSWKNTVDQRHSILWM